MNKNRIFIMIPFLFCNQNVIEASAKLRSATDAKCSTLQPFCLQRVLNKALIEAVEHGNIVDVQGLLEHKADPTIPNSRGFSLLVSAGNNPKITELLIAHGACKQTGFNERLFAAVQWGEHINDVRELLDCKADSNFFYNGHSLLHMAAVKGCHEITQLLLDRNIKVDVKDVDGNTALTNVALKVVQRYYSMHFESDEFSVRLEKEEIAKLKKTAMIIKKIGAKIPSTYLAGPTHNMRPFTCSNLIDLYNRLYLEKHRGYPCIINFVGLHKYNAGKKDVEDFQKKLLGTEIAIL